MNRRQRELLQQHRQAVAERKAYRAGMIMGALGGAGAVGLLALTLLLIGG